MINDDKLDVIAYNEKTFNIAMTDSFMKIFGFHRTSPTDKELEEKYKGENKK